MAGMALISATAFSPPAFAQAGPLGTYPDSRSIAPRCPAGSVYIGGRCVRPETGEECPPGTIGHYPNCRRAVRQQCPPGSKGVFPVCRPTLPPQPGNPRSGQPPYRPPTPEIR